MALSKTKSLILCLVLVSMVVLSHGFAAKRIDAVVALPDPCKLPSGALRLGCSPNNGQEHEQPFSPYKRGCSIIHRCTGLRV